MAISQASFIVAVSEDDGALYPADEIGEEDKQFYWLMEVDLPIVLSKEDIYRHYGAIAEILIAAGKARKVQIFDSATE